MKRILFIFALIFLITPLYAESAVDDDYKGIPVADHENIKQRWGVEPYNNPKGSVRAGNGASESGGFLVDTHYITLSQNDTTSESEHRGDNRIAFVAEKIVERGGCFVPVDIFCKHEFRHKAKLTFYTPKTSNKTSDISSCVWLCTGGYYGVGCQDMAIDTTNRVDWWGLDDTKRKELTWWGEKESDFQGNNRLLSYFHRRFRDGMVAGDSYDIHTVLGITDFMEHGVKASPVDVACWGAAYGNDQTKKFSGIGTYAKALGNTQLLCPQGYKPNKSGTDCEEMFPPEPSKERKTESPDGSTVNTRGSEEVSNIDELTNNSEYDEDIHSVQPSEDEKTVRLFCKGTEKALAARGSFKCIDCPTTAKGGECLYTSSANFGVCMSCKSSGKIYNPETCDCDSAMAISVSELVYGKNNGKKDQNSACWTKDSVTEYKNCVFGKE